MTSEDIQKFAEALKEADIMFSLTTITDDEHEYWCYTGDEPAKILCNTVINIVLQLLDGGNSIEDVKNVFSAILEEAGKNHVEQAKYLQ